MDNKQIRNWLLLVMMLLIVLNSIKKIEMFVEEKGKELPGSAMAPVATTLHPLLL